MSDVNFVNVEDFFRMQVAGAAKWFENNAIAYNAVRKYSDKKKLTPKGYRFHFWKNRPGGHTFPTVSSPDFNAAKPPQSESFFIRATEYALPMVIHGRTLDAIRSGVESALTGMAELIGLYTETATKRLEMMVPGDGTGALAYANLGATLNPGAGTLVCHTAPNTTAGYTKGAFRLEVGQYYQAWDPTTGALHGTFHVTTAGTSQCEVVVDSGTVVDEDIITDVGAFRKVPRGMAHLVADNSRTLQTIATGTNPEWNSPLLDLANRKATPSDISQIKTTLNTRNNDTEAEMGLVCFTTNGQMENLKKQGYGFRRYTGSESVKGISKKYEDGDTIWVEAADWDEDRLTFIKPGILVNCEEKAFGEYKEDGLDWRMLLGANSTGSNRWQRAWGVIHNLGITNVRAAAGIIRATPGVTQVTAGR